MHYKLSFPNAGTKMRTPLFTCICFSLFFLKVGTSVQTTLAVFILASVYRPSFPKDGTSMQTMFFIPPSVYQPSFRRMELWNWHAGDVLYTSTCVVAMLPEGWNCHAHNVLCLHARIAHPFRRLGLPCTQRPVAYLHARIFHPFRKLELACRRRFKKEITFIFYLHPFRRLELRA